MPNRNYEKGRRFEYVEKKRLENLGYIVLRTSGSHGFADLVAVKPGEVRFIQCKAQPATKADVKKYKNMRIYRMNAPT
jgi:Holliday junction resolvase